MNKLPVEIVYHITSYLTYSDKLNLSCVCREWYNLVRTTCLYTHFTIKDTQRFDTAISIFKEHPQLCYQARSLRLTRMNNKFQEILQLPTLFPHLTHLAYQSYNRHYDGDLELSKQDMKLWRRLECYEETNKNPLFMLLLTNVEFPELRKMKIDFCMKYSHCDDLFRLMKSAPNLECFELSFATVNLEMMEVLHDNLPSLKTLILSDIKDAPSNLGLTFETQQQAGTRTDETSNHQLIDGQHPISIKPASGITNLQITDMMTVNGNHCMPLQWIVYIALKYKEAEHLTIRKRINDNQFMDYYSTGARYVLSKLQKLDSYDSNVLLLNDASSLLTHLKKVNLSNQIVDQLCYLTESQHRQSLRHVMIKHQALIPSVVGHVKHFENLRSLRIESSSKEQDASIEFDTILAKLGCLEDLMLSGYDVRLSPKSSRRFYKVFKLRTLILKRVSMTGSLSTDVSDNVINFISQTCLHLTKITLQGKVMRTHQQLITLNFPEHMLKSMNVSNIGNRLYKVDNGVSTKWYSFNGQKLEEREKEPFEDSHVSIVHKRTCRITLHGTNLPNYF